MAQIISFVLLVAALIAVASAQYLGVGGYRGLGYGGLGYARSPLVGGYAAGYAGHGYGLGGLRGYGAYPGVAGAFYG